ncbi:MAG: galactose oxidase, partial [Gemmatimonadales bacterium]
MRLPRIFALLAMLGFGPAAGTLPPLPEPVTNNVVAVARAAGRDHVVSLLGLGPGKTWRDLRAGGYMHVSGSESSTPYVYALDVASRRYDRLADIPTPVDDSVALVYQDRYVYLISGWHDKDNVALVQLYDAVENRWRQATVFPGTPVFGHAGGIAGRRMLVCDGVQVVRQSGPGRYAPSDECWLGEIDKRAPERIDWTRNSAHPGVPRYR